MLFAKPYPRAASSYLHLSITGYKAPVGGSGDDHWYKVALKVGGVIQGESEMSFAGSRVWGDLNTCVARYTNGGTSAVTISFAAYIRYGNANDSLVMILQNAHLTVTEVAR